MHPEVRQDHPGVCPICGMALEPELVGVTTGPGAEYLDMRRRLWIAGALGLPVFGLEMGGHLLPALHHLVAPALSHGVQAVLATPVVLWAGWPFFARAWVSPPAWWRCWHRAFSRPSSVTAWAWCRSISNPPR